MQKSGSQSPRFFYSISSRNNTVSWFPEFFVQENIAAISRPRHIPPPLPP